jgi:hypothetical protein
MRQQNAFITPLWLVDPLPESGRPSTLTALDVAKPLVAGRGVMVEVGGLFAKRSVVRSPVVPFLARLKTGHRLKEESCDGFGGSSV